MRRWRKILLIGACGIVLLIACAALLWDALATKPTIVHLPDGTTLRLYAVTYGMNPRFPPPNPLKRLVSEARHLIPFRGYLGSGGNERTAFWWFTVNPPVSLGGGLLSWHAQVTTTTNDLSYMRYNNGSSMMQQTTQPGTLGIYLPDCPSNTATMVLSFYSERFHSDKSFVTNITVPNPMYRR